MFSSGSDVFVSHGRAQEKAAGGRPSQALHQHHPGEMKKSSSSPTVATLINGRTSSLQAFIICQLPRVIINVQVKAKSPSKLCY